MMICNKVYGKTSILINSTDKKYARLLCYLYGIASTNYAIALMAARVLSFRKRKPLLLNQYVHDLHSNVRVWATSV